MGIIMGTETPNQNGKPYNSAHVLDHVYRIDQGFDVYDDEMEEPLLAESPVRKNLRIPEHTRRWLDKWTEPFQRKAEVTVSRAIEWLEAGREEPFFCWVHLFDPHLAYSPPDPWTEMYGGDYEGGIDGTAESFERIARETGGRIPVEHVDRMIALYDGEVSYSDHWVGRLLEAVPESTLVVFTSDHGEAFGEHGRFFEHQQTIFSETMRVPLILI